VQPPQAFLSTPAPLPSARALTRGARFYAQFDPDEIGIPDYFDIVPRAMDLGSIQVRCPPHTRALGQTGARLGTNVPRRLRLPADAIADTCSIPMQQMIENGTYERSCSDLPHHEQVDEDVQLVFANALLYNPAGTDVAKAAEQCRGVWDGQIAKIRAEAAAEASLPEGDSASHALALPAVERNPGRSCGFGSTGDGAGDPLGVDLPQRRLAHFAVVRADNGTAEPVESCAREGHQSVAVGVLLREGREGASSPSGKLVSIRVEEVFLEWSEADPRGGMVWLRGEHAWYRCAQPAESYAGALASSAFIMKVADCVKSFVWATPKTGSTRLLQSTARKAEQFALPDGKKAKKSDPKPGKLQALGGDGAAPLLVACIDDISALNRKILTRALTQQLVLEAADARGAAMTADGLPGARPGEAPDDERVRFQICGALSAACIGAEVEATRRLRGRALEEAQEAEEIGKVMDAILDKVDTAPAPDPRRGGPRHSSAPLGGC
jgi:hypothetical protein